MTEPERQTDRTRGGNGRYTSNRRTAERDARAADLRSRGWSYRRIADELGIRESTAHDAVQRVLNSIREEPAQDVRALELERLDRMYDAVVGVLEREHFTVSNGKVVYHGDDDPKPLLDDGPVLQAVDRLLKIQERRARLLGLDSPIKADVGGKLTYEILGVDMSKI